MFDSSKSLGLSVIALLVGAGVGVAASVPINSVGTAQLKTGAVTTAKLHSGAVTNAKLHIGAVSNSKILNGAVSGTKIANGAVGAAQLAPGSVDSSKLGLASVGTDQLIAGSVGAAQLAASGVGTAQLASGSVTNGKIGSGAVTVAKLAQDAKDRAPYGTSGSNSSIQFLTTTSPMTLGSLKFAHPGTYAVMVNLRAFVSSGTANSAIYCNLSTFGVSTTNTAVQYPGVNQIPITGVTTISFPGQQADLSCQLGNTAPPVTVTYDMFATKIIDDNPPS